VVAAYVAASRRVIDGTTEVAALVVLSAGILAGTATSFWPARSPPSQRSFSSRSRACTR
jgi:hypothetical protein